jgi:hypothetical protein
MSRQVRRLQAPLQRRCRSSYPAQLVVEKTASTLQIVVCVGGAAGARAPLTVCRVGRFSGPRVSVAVRPSVLSSAANASLVGASTVATRSGADRESAAPAACRRQAGGCSRVGGPAVALEGQPCKEQAGQGWGVLLAARPVAGSSTHAERRHQGAEVGVGGGHLHHVLAGAASLARVVRQGVGVENDRHGFSQG